LKGKWVKKSAGKALKLFSALWKKEATNYLQQPPFPLPEQHPLKCLK